MNTVFLLSSKILINPGSFYYLLFGFKVISLHFEIAYPEITLGFDSSVTEEILDGYQICIGVEHLRGHSVAQLVAADIQADLFCVMLHAILNAALLYRFAVIYGDTFSAMAAIVRAGFTPSAVGITLPSTTYKLG